MKPAQLCSFLKAQEESLSPAHLGYWQNSVSVATDWGHYAEKVAEENFSGQRKTKCRKIGINTILFHLKVLQIIKTPSMWLNSRQVVKLLEHLENWQCLRLSCCGGSTSPLSPHDVQTVFCIVSFPQFSDLETTLTPSSLFPPGQVCGT